MGFAPAGMRAVDDRDGEKDDACYHCGGAEVVHFDARCLAFGDVGGDVEVRGYSCYERQDAADPEEPAPAGVLACYAGEENTCAVYLLASSAKLCRRCLGAGR